MSCTPHYLYPFFLSFYLKNSTNSVLDSYEYTYNTASQRTNLVRADASTVAYKYDNIGQLKVADSSVNTEDRGYAYDSAWNLNYRTNNGSLDTFTVNNLNELATVPSGSASYDTNGNLTNSPAGDYVYDDENRLVEWSQGAPTDGALATTFAYDGRSRLRTRAEFRGDGSQWVLQSVVDYIYDGMRVIQERDGDNNPQVSYTRGTDLSGSMEGAGGIGGLLARSDGYSCCGTSLTVSITNASSVINMLVWIYSAAGTNVDGVVVWAGTSSDFTFTATAGVEYTIYGTDTIYHGLGLLDVFTPTLDHRTVELSSENPEIFASSTSGGELCGPPGTWPCHNYYFADGNGNITTLLDDSQNVSASYRYDPFGYTIGKDGPLADANVYRFSSKEILSNSGMYSYLYRSYDSSLQRWMNRDPLGELGFHTMDGFDMRYASVMVPRWLQRSGLNAYTYIRNSPGNSWDPFGLFGGPYTPPPGAIPVPCLNGMDVAATVYCAFKYGQIGICVAWVYEDATGHVHIDVVFECFPCPGTGTGGKR